MKNNIIYSISLLILLPFVSFGQSDKSLIRQGNKDFTNGEYSEAEIDYRKALDKSPNNSAAQFNLGDAMYAQENYEKAAEVFSKTNMEKSTDTQKSEVYYNYGNAMLKAGKLNESIEAYKQSLRHMPTNQEARYNLEYAKQKQQQQQQQQDKQDQQDKQEQKDEKQEQNQDQQEQDQKDQQDKKDEKQEPQDQNQDQQQQDQKDQPQGQQGEQNEQQAQKISKKDAEKMLEALKNNEKKTLEKLQKAKKENAKTVKSEKDW